MLALPSIQTRPGRRKPRHHRAMIAPHLIVDRIAIHRLDGIELRPSAGAALGIGFAHLGKLRHDRRIGKVLNPRAVEGHAGKGHHVKPPRPRLRRAMKGVKRAVSNRDLQELIGVGVQDPIRILVKPVLARIAQRHHLPVALRREHHLRIDPVMHRCNLRQPIQQAVGLVIAIVRDHQNAVNAKRQMMRHPFQHIGALILHRRDHQNRFAVHHASQNLLRIRHSLGRRAPPLPS